MAKLPNRHPKVAKEFNNGKFVVDKARQVFSGIPIGQAQNKITSLSKEMEGP